MTAPPNGAVKSIFNRLFVTDEGITPSSTITLSLVTGAVAPDFALGSFFELTLDGTNTLNNPTNMTVNQNGSIVIKQPAAGAKTLSFGAYYFFPNGVDPTISPASNAIDVIYWHVISSTQIICTVVPAVA
jgi:hypothetical protein